MPAEGPWGGEGTAAPGERTARLEPCMRPDFGATDACQRRSAPGERRPYRGGSGFRSRPAPKGSALATCLLSNRGSTQAVGELDPAKRLSKLLVGSQFRDSGAVKGVALTDAL